MELKYQASYRSRGLKAYSVGEIQGVTPALELAEPRLRAAEGKLEPGETPQACVLREFAEETGLTLTEFAYRGVVTFISEDWTEEMHLFTASAAEGALRACDEGELAWVPTGELTRLPIWEGDKVFLRLLETGRAFFRLTLIYEGESLAGVQLDGQELDVQKALGHA